MQLFAYWCLLPSFQQLIPFLWEIPFAYPSPVCWVWSCQEWCNSLIYILNGGFQLALFNIRRNSRMIHFFVVWKKKIYHRWCCVIWWMSVPLLSRNFLWILFQLGSVDVCFWICGFLHLLFNGVGGMSLSGCIFSVVYLQGEFQSPQFSYIGFASSLWAVNL